MNLFSVLKLEIDILVTQRLEIWFVLSIWVVSADFLLCFTKAKLFIKKYQNLYQMMIIYA